MLPWSQLCFVTGALNKPGCQNAQVLKDSLWAGGSDGKESSCNVGDLGQEDPLEKGMATQSSILAWRIPWTEEPGLLQSMGSQRVRHG